MYKRLLVAFDGSEQSYKALDHAVALAEKFDSELIVLTVISNLTDPFFSDEIFDPTVYIKCQERMNEFYHNMLKDAEEMISTKHPNLNIQIILREGRPSATIVDVSEEGGMRYDSYGQPWHWRYQGMGARKHQPKGR